jgi:predicted SnoaL-like aldol condensation-catalyzing enzyme
VNESSTLRESAVSFLRLAAAGHVEEAYEKFVAIGFRHHNPYFAGDAESLKAGMRENAIKNPGKIFEVQRTLQDDLFVTVHSRVRMNESHAGVAVVHIFRFDGGKVVELWDIGQPVPEKVLNEHGMF